MEELVGFEVLAAVVMMGSIFRKPMDFLEEHVAYIFTVRK
jgi:hypothetical protein